MQISHPVGSQQIHIELITTVPGEYRHPAKGHHLHTVLRLKAQVLGRRTKHDTAEHPVGILQRKIVVARGVFFIVGNLAPNGHTPQIGVGIEAGFQILVELTDGQYLGFHGKAAHPRRPLSSARWVKMATPMALSVEY